MKVNKIIKILQKMPKNATVYCFDSFTYAEG